MIKSFKVYGADGHRQKQSFGKTEHFDFSTETELRKVSIIREDITKTNEYAIIEIEMNTEQEIMDELDGQLSDGFFENVRTGEIEEVKRIVVRDREAGNIIEEVASFAEGLKLIQEYEKADMDNDEYTEDFYEVAALQGGTEMKKTYYFPDSDYTDKFFVNGEEVCFDLAEAKRLAGDWGISLEHLMEQLHEATEPEIEEYGTYEA